MENFIACIIFQVAIFCGQDFDCRERLEDCAFDEGSLSRCVKIEYQLDVKDDCISILGL